MREQLEERLQDLKKELEAGQKVLADLDARRLDVQQTILRISGAVQVLEELLAPPEAPAANGSAAPAAVPEPAAELVGA